MEFQNSKKVSAMRTPILLLTILVQWYLNLMILVRVIYTSGEKPCGVRKMSNRKHVLRRKLFAGSLWCQDLSLFQV